jgi:type II secretory pathway pseudopilin PulG
MINPLIRKQAGFSYLIAMFLVAVVAIISVRALENSMTQERREKEAELLLVGQAYRNAIRTFYENSPGTSKTYPAELTALLLDERTTRLRRPLRKLYRDPISASHDWGIVRSESGGVMGVYSLSTLKPIKTDGFPAELGHFKNAQHYKEWQFVYQPI